MPKLTEEKIAELRARLRKPYSHIGVDDWNEVMRSFSGLISDLDEARKFLSDIRNSTSAKPRNPWSTAGDDALVIGHQLTVLRKRAESAERALAVMFCDAHRPNASRAYNSCLVCSRNEDAAMVEEFLKSLGWAHDEEAELNLHGWQWYCIGEEERGTWDTQTAFTKAMEDYDALRDAHKKARLALAQSERALAEARQQPPAKAGSIVGDIQAFADEWHKRAHGLQTENAALRSRLEEVENWKREALVVLNNLDLQEIGKALGLKLGSEISSEVLPGIRRLQSRVTALEKALGIGGCPTN